jgi:uncharacterized protein
MRRLATFAAMLGVAMLAGGALANPPPANDAALGPDGSTPLQWAVYRNDVAEVKRLLAGGAKVSAANAYGVTPMQLAAEMANTDVIQLLLKAGADVESPNAEGQTALMSVARTGNVEAAKLLLKRGAKVNAAENFGGQTALMWAAARRHPEMVELLASKGADLNARAIVRQFERHITAEQRYKNTHTGGLTPLLYAVRENCKACVDIMIRRGADIALPDPDGIAPLTLAMANGNWDIAKRLVEAGADVNQWDIYGQAPLHVAIENAYVSRGGVTNPGSDKTPNATDGRQVVRMLLDRGADPNQQMFFRAPRERGQVSTSARGTTPFHRAVASLEVDFIKQLLAAGADATLYTAAGETPIMIAVDGSRGTEEQVIAVVRLLKEAGTDLNAVQQVVYMTRDHGGSALHAATRKGSRKVMAELVKLGANPDVKDQDGLTALDYAMSRGWLTYLTTRPPPREDLAKLLRDLGAKVELSKVPDWPGEFPPIGPPRQHESEIWPL